ncbi:helix-turn-helix domain-containing protein [Candidatus Nephthysia bennettiae]|uniref:Helix-turn-helix domain-containing protein n=1 Tax=Candidatus Nephthysia bennettiae TaxID=3127016 RepID=A0A934NA07_9BACT|nr:helix-turn-helix domain-containing protein [Candidatus Dormibacteraeota bacterium]MBJ7612544.1 helix-turn-helix domain-containing protein [Candidatus Dormibacteraeota bacterium]
MATRSNQGLPDSLLEELQRRRPGLARHMTRAVVMLVRWDTSTGAPPRPEAIAKACEAGIDLFLATARERRPATSRELREVAQLGILQARGSHSVEPVLAAYRIAARVAWDAILGAWRTHPDASPEAMVVTANYVFAALDQVAAEVTKTYLHAREQHLLRGTRARARLLHSLISDTFDTELAVHKQALAVNQRLANSYLALVVKTESGAAELLAELELPAGALADATDPHTAVLLWPADAADVREEVQRLIRELRGRGQSRVRAGLGGEHPGLRGISRSYLEAQEAVEVGRKLDPNGILHEYDEVAPYLILSQNPMVAERYVSHVLGKLLASDPRGVLMETLEALLTSGSVKAAAASLRLHRHTVLYRMEKLRELLGLDLDDPAVRQRLQLALALRRLA